MVQERDLFPVSGQSGLNFETHRMHSLMKDRVTSLSNLCRISTKRLVVQIFF